ncbi:ABC transporter substrate-binding protein [Brevibacillus daliensis]|uniref:ABC transporter substrate-binding protein n=1 Tax=Brevibacillus daliensis TaxID=2892995 RepID=UPI001E58DAAC|nr:ABC transporter substrate-binding protein [Brevibacillus daliensis]
MNNRHKVRFLSTMVILLVLVLTACGNKATNTQEGASNAQATTSQETNGYQPFELTNLDNTITYTQAPKRAITLNQHATEVMLALGLQDSMVGTAYLDDKILPEFQEAYAKIPVLSPKYPSKEIFIAQEPDFAYAGWKSAFTEKTLGTVQDLNQAGINTYVQESSIKTAPSLEDVYTDIQNIGRIFGVEDKANELIDTMKKEIENTTKKIGEVTTPVNVFLYDSGDDKALTAANNYITQLIKIAGGKNIFDDIEKSWAEVSWEEVVSRNPDVIVIIDYGDQSVDQKKELLLSKPALADVTAIKNERFIVLPLSAVAEGVRAPMALTILGEGFYPDRMKE